MGKWRSPILVVLTAACTSKQVIIVPARAPNGVSAYQRAAVRAFTDASGLGATATCDEPDSTDVGTTFNCVGTGADGTVFPLVATIDKNDHVLVNSADTGP